MQNTNFTGFLCEYSDAETPVCGAEAVVEIKDAFSYGDNGENLVSEAYACAKHTEHMNANQSADLYLLPSFTLVEAL